jgi:hypothetical protein
LYQPDSLLVYIEACVDEISRDLPTSLIVIAGDLNQLSDQHIVERTGFMQIVQQPTRGASILDHTYVLGPQYSVVRVAKSVVKSDHRAVVAFAEYSQSATIKTTVWRTYRKKTLTQHALFLQHVATIDLDSLQPSSDTQSEFDQFYTKATEFLNQFYPERTITIKSRDPEYITPELKAKLRRKNRLMQAGRVEEACALAQQIGKELKRQSKSHLCKVDGKSDAKDMWEEVRRLTGHRSEVGDVPGINAVTLNSHYAAISSDTSYQQPLHKQSANPKQLQYITEYLVVKILDSLRPILPQELIFYQPGFWGWVRRSFQSR